MAVPCMSHQALTPLLIHTQRPHFIKGRHSDATVTLVPNTAEIAVHEATDTSAAETGVALHPYSLSQQGKTRGNKDCGQSSLGLTC